MKYLFVILTFVSFSCGNNSAIKHAIESPLDILNERLTRKIESELGLYSLKDSESQFEIRIYNEFSLGTPDRLIIIKQQDSIHQAVVYEYHVSHLKEKRNSEPLEAIHDNMHIDSATYFRLSPRQDWSTFMDSLHQFKLEDKITQSNIQGFENQVSDGYSFVIEIRQGKKYNFIVYHCPDYYEDPENVEITLFINFIRRNLTYLFSCKNHS